MSVLLVLLLAQAPVVEKARGVLTAAAAAKEPDQRRDAAQALSLAPVGDPAVAILETLVGDKDYQVRVAAVETLGELGDRKRVGVVKARLGDEVPEVAFAAARALYAMKAPEGVEALGDIFAGEKQGNSNFFKKELMGNLRRMKTPRGALMLAMQHGIGFVPVPGLGAGYGAMQGMLNDVDFSARATSLLLLCQTAGKACEQALAMSFGDEDWSVRAAGVAVVAQRRLRQWEAQVGGLLEDRKERVRLRAAATVLRLEAGKAAKRGKK